MKHYSAAALRRRVPEPLCVEGDLVARLRGELAKVSKAALAARIGVTEGRLTGILRGVHPLPDGIAAKLGYRKVTRFERIS